MITRAVICIWAKGFRVTERSEEFQLVVPHDSKELGPFEHEFSEDEWGVALTELYRADSSTWSAQFHVALGNQTVGVTRVAQSADKHGRPSAVAVRVLAESTQGLAKPASLALQLASTYAETLRGAPRAIGIQLKDNRFLEDRTFDLNSVAGDTSVDWEPIETQLRLHTGISTIATSLLASLGANLLIGRIPELRTYPDIDGIFDPTAGELLRLSDKISPIEEIKPVTTEAPTIDDLRDALREIRETQHQILERQLEFSERFAGFFEYAFRIFYRLMDFRDSPDTKDQKESKSRR